MISMFFITANFNILFSLYCSYDNPWVNSNKLSMASSMCSTLSLSLTFSLINQNFVTFRTFNGKWFQKTIFDQINFFI